MINALTTLPGRFVRRTTLREGEYRTDFRQIDRDAIEVVTSEEASRVTNLISKIYLRLIDAPGRLRESEGVLRFTGEEREGQWLTAWEQLIDMLDVASATAQKALTWLHEQGVIGYDAHRNGVGIRVFINRAAASIRTSQTGSNQKNLLQSRTSSIAAHTSRNDVPFNDSFAVVEVLETDFIPHQSKDGLVAGEAIHSSGHLEPTPTGVTQPREAPAGRQEKVVAMSVSAEVSVDDIVGRVRREMEPSIRHAAMQAATREHEKTRQWLDTHGIPKATRVAQKEAFNVLRQHGLVNASAQHSSIELQTACPPQACTAPPPAQLRSPKEIREIAEMCVALLEMQSKPIEATLSEISSDGAGWILPEDTPRVREAAQALMLSRSIGNLGNERSTS